MSEYVGVADAEEDSAGVLRAMRSRTEWVGNGAARAVFRRLLGGGGAGAPPHPPLLCVWMWMTARMYMMYEDFASF